MNASYTDTFRLINVHPVILKCNAFKSNFFAHYYVISYVTCFDK